MGTIIGTPFGVIYPISATTKPIPRAREGIYKV